MLTENPAMLTKNQAIQFYNLSNPNALNRLRARDLILPSEKEHEELQIEFNNSNNGNGK